MEYKLLPKGRSNIIFDSAPFNPKSSGVLAVSMALSFETCKTYKLVGAVSTEQLRFILDPTRD